MSDTTGPGAVTKEAWQDVSGQKWARQQERTDAQLGAAVGGQRRD